MKKLCLVVPISILLVGCGGDGGDGGSSDTKGSTMDCEISGDKTKAELAVLDEGKTHEIVVDTSKGSFTFELATDISPCTTASIESLLPERRSAVPLDQTRRFTFKPCSFSRGR